MAYKIINPPKPEVENRVVSGPKEKVFEHAMGEGEDLDKAAIELGAPDRPVGKGAPIEAGQPHGHAHKEVPVYPDANPWPPVVVGHKPMKLK